MEQENLYNAVLDLEKARKPLTEKEIADKARMLIERMYAKMQEDTEKGIYDYSFILER